MFVEKFKIYVISRDLHHNPADDTEDSDPQLDLIVFQLELRGFIISLCQSDWQYDRYLL